MHVQFETIHPFVDGNGRLGRLLITFLLCANEVIREPILYLSLYLKTHRTAYYDLLNRVRTQGDWEAWLDFFLEASKRRLTKPQARHAVQWHSSNNITGRLKRSGDPHRPSYACSNICSATLLFRFPTQLRGSECPHQL